MRTIDQTIILALKAEIKASGSLFAFSRKLGVSHSTVIFWLNGRTRHINTALWQKKLYPILERSLITLLPGITVYRLRKMYFEQYQEPFGQESILSIPILGEKDFLQYDAHIESLDNFARKSSTQTLFQGFSSERYYALRLEQPGNIYPPGALIFISSSEEPEYGALICCKFCDSREVMICVFEKDGDIVRLSPINHNCKVLEWDFHKNPNVLDWLFPVFGIRINGREPEVIPL